MSTGDPDIWLNEYIPSNNFIKSLLRLAPQLDSSFLEIHGYSSYGNPILDSGKKTIRMNQDYFQDFEKVLKFLSPKDEVTKSMFIGRVSGLCGEPTSDGRPAGEVEVSVQYDEEILKAKINLNADQYEIALKAHGASTFISLHGELKQGVRAHRINNIENFKLLS